MMMKRILFVVGLFLGILGFAQNYPMTSANNGQTFVTCSGTFTDDGGPGSDYGNNITNRTITFCTANPGELLRFDFTSFNTEANWDELEVFNGPTATGVPFAIYSGNIGAFVFISNQPGGCVTFRFTSDSGVTRAGWVANISCVEPCVAPTAALVDASTLDICSSEANNAGDLTVDFDASNSVSNDTFNIVRYEWNWGDGTTSITTTPTTTHTFPDDPGIYTVTLKVRTANTGTDPLGCLSSNTAVKIIRVLPPPNFEGTTEGPIDLNCGESVTLTGIASSQIITQEPPPNVGSEISLPDGDGVSYYSYLDLTGYFPPGATLTASCFPEIMIELEHSFAGDLWIDLIAPTGEEVRLFNGYGPFGGEKFGYCVNGADNGQPGCVAPYHIVNSGGINWGAAAGYTNFTQNCDVYSGTCESGQYFLQDGTFNSSQNMNALVGAELNGIWVLKISDEWALDDGFISTWSISFPGDCYTDLETETPILSGGLWTGGGPAVPTPQTVNDVPFLPTTIDPCPGDADCTGNQLSNTVTVGPFINGGSYTYTFTVTDEFGCEYQREVVINVDCPCSLELTSAQGTDNQELCIGNSIVDITYEAGGNATDVVVTGLPQGVTWTFVNGILTISGTPTETGTFNYSVTTVGCEQDITLTGTIIINPEPLITPITDPLEFCTDSTTTYDFDLTQVEVDLVANPQDYNFTYYEDQSDAEVPQNNILVPTAYPVSVTAPTTVYIRVEDTVTGCYVITEIIIQPGEGVTLTAPSNAIELCDDNFDETFEYDLTLLNDQVAYPSLGLQFTYYASQADYNNDNPIPGNQINNYSLTLPASIWVAATNSDGCSSEAVEVQFVEGQRISLLSGPYEIPFCEGDGVNLTQYQNIYTSETGVNYSYYLTYQNASNETGQITGITNYTPAGIGSTIFVRLEKQDGSLCPEIVEVEFTAGQEVMHNQGPFGPIEYCEDEIIDISDFTGNMANESGVTFSYYETLPNAQNETNPIPDETAFAPTGNGIIYVRLEKADRCAVILQLPYEQKLAPSIIDLPSEIVLCEGQETVDLVVSSDDPGATFEWSWGNNQTHSGSAITISQIGTYTLTVIGSNECRNEAELIVRPGGQPIITSIESGSDYLIVFAQSGGGGTLEYSLNGVLWQTSPRFDGLVKGQVYTIYVREDGCLIKTHQAVILDVPNFISPNGDGYNDEWTIRGIEVTSKATIKIFDRYGKIFVDTNFDGNYVWDGKYGGRPLPSGDYWYILDVPGDGVVIAQKFLGHVSIRN